MNPEIKAEWVAALRSGDYTQGAFVLRNVNDEYCCLGVLCELAVKHEIIAPAVPYEPAAGEYKYGDGEDRSTATLPKSVSDWAGLDSMWGSQETDLAALNDEKSMFGRHKNKFPDIADVIEKAL